MRRLLALLSCTVLLVVATGAVAVASTPAPVVYPTVTGSFNQTPKISFPDVSEPTTLGVKVLDQGSGAAVKKGELLVVNYLGQIWRGKIFDSSFSRGLFGFTVGVGQVITGWDKSLVGQRIGSRVLLVLPPADAYPEGNTGAGITKSDTLVFVVDLVDVYNGSAQVATNAKLVTSSAGGVTVSGKLGTQPKVTIAKGTAEPTKVSLTLLDRGTGPAVKPGLVVLQTLVTNWSGAVQASTWALGAPDSETVGDKAAPSALDGLVGEPIGSCVLIEIPKNSSGGPYAVVAEVVAEPRGASTEPS